MATKIVRPAAPRTTRGAPLELAEAATQTFKRGGLVKLATNAITATGLAATDVQLGIPAADAHNTTGATVSVYHLADNDVVEMTLYHSTPASAVFATTDIGAEYGVTVDNGAAVVNKADVTNKRVKILALVREPGDDPADLYPRVLVKIVNAGGAAATGNWL